MKNLELDINHIRYWRLWYDDTTSMNFISYKTTRINSLKEYHKLYCEALNTCPDDNERLERVRIYKGILCR